MGCDTIVILGKATHVSRSEEKIMMLGAVVIMMVLVSAMFSKYLDVERYALWTDSKNTVSLLYCLAMVACLFMIGMELMR